jgi:ATP-binding cassette subfamily B protein/ATP-binding cassette subfamily C protein
MKEIVKLNILLPVFAKLYRLLNQKFKLYFCLLIALSIGFSLIETIGITAIMPFISLASDPGLLNSGWYKKAFDFTGIANTETFIIALGIGIIVFYFFRAIYFIFQTYCISRFSLSMYRHLSKRCFQTILSVSYRAYVQKNSAEQMRTITEETNDVSNIVSNGMNLCSELFTIILVYTVIVILNWKMTVVITIILLITVLFLYSVLTKKNKALGIKRLESGRMIYRSLKETLGNIKFVKLKGNEEKILHNYDTNVKVKARSEILNTVFGLIPKGILESFGFSLLVAAVVLLIWIYHDASRVIPIITMYALALYRILPSVHRMLQNISKIAYLQRTLDSVDECLKQPIEHEGSASVEFEQSIRLEDIYFKYMTGGEIINGISLNIKKGEKVAITGESGGGKSTLVDVIIGIHKPFLGRIYIDNTEITDENIRSWRNKIGYIPQSIYLFDGTVADNISFGSEQDEGKIIKALVKANIWDFLVQKDGIHTRVGDGGIHLSGGQQQRIGIARALYDDPEILVLDEATSALDTETEQKIMDEIYNVSSNKTLIIIAHRLSTVQRCDRKILIENGKIINE